MVPIRVWRRFGAMTLLLLGGCAPPAALVEGASCALPDAPLLISFGEIEMAPGTSHRLEVFSSTHPGAVDPLPPGCRTSWSLEAGAPASLTSEGALQVSPDAEDGARFTVSARVADRPAAAEVRVVDAASSPLVGTWVQASVVPCGGPARDVAPAERIQELRLRRNGRFSVTWVPFETYTDYSGTYTYETATAELRLQVEGSNFLPRDLDLEGRAEVDAAGSLHLTDLWLGSRAEGAERGCGAIFRRAGAS